jgi:hypothetical protein
MSFYSDDRGIGSRRPGHVCRRHARTKKNKRKWDGKRGNPPSQCSDRRRMAEGSARRLDLLSGPIAQQQVWATICCNVAAHDAQVRK